MRFLKNWRVHLYPLHPSTLSLLLVAKITKWWLPYLIWKSKCKKMDNCRVINTNKGWSSNLPLESWCRKWDNFRGIVQVSISPGNGIFSLSGWAFAQIMFMLCFKLPICGIDFRTPFDAFWRAVSTWMLAWTWNSVVLTKYFPS